MNINNTKILVTCEECGKERELRYTKHPSKLCKKCSNTSVHKNKIVTPETRLKLSISHTGKVASIETRLKLSEQRQGDKNGFYGRKHTESAKNKISKHSALLSESGYFQSQDFRHKVSIGTIKGFDRKERDTGIRQKSVYDIWVDKYGADIANDKDADRKAKWRKSSAGENNPMYGKIAPIGSGNGWSGWYRGIYFRSLLELSYLIYMMDHDILFESGECVQHRIKYDDNKNYYCDYYLVLQEQYIEIKPSALLYTESNLKKFKSAKDKFGDKFVVLTEKEIDKISNDRILEEYKCCNIIFIDRWDKKYRERYLK